LNFADIDQVKAARNVIVTCEEIVDTEQLRDKPEYNSIPFIHVDAVVHVPFGAYPTACHNFYDYDPIYLRHISHFAKDEKLYAIPGKDSPWSSRSSRAVESCGQRATGHYRRR